MLPRGNESRASRVQQRRRRDRVAELTGRAAALAGLAWPPVVRAVAAAAAGLAAALPAALEPVAVWLLAVGLMAGLAYVGGLLSLAAVRVLAPDRKDSTPSGADNGPASSRVPAFIAFLVTVLLAAVVVQAAAAVSGGFWWIVSALVIAAGGVLALQVSPPLVALTFGARPVGDPVTVERLARLARTAGVEVASIHELPDGASSSTAFVAGFGDRRSVFLAATALRDWTPDEVDVVVAHELGHHRRGDLWRSMLVDALVLAAGLATVARAAAAGWLSPPAAGATALPALALVTWGCWMACAPIRFALSRHQEREADAFALALTGQVEAFASVIRRLGKIHLADERPSALVRLMTYRHPTVPERLAAAETFRRSRR